MINQAILSRPSDDRISQRDRIVKMAQVSDGNNFSIDCVLLDISLGGAQLVYCDPAIVPDLVYVRLPDGNAVSSRVRWRTANAFGVEFLKQTLRDW